jgi:hypothetical protein
MVPMVVSSESPFVEVTSYIAVPFFHVYFILVLRSAKALAWTLINGEKKKEKKETFGWCTLCNQTKFLF